MTPDDAAQDAAVVLITMRDRWKGEKAEHLSEERQERLIISWARLRLIDQYESVFSQGKRETLFSDLSPNNQHLPNPLTDPVDPRTDPSAPVRLSDLDEADIKTMVERLPERLRVVTKHLLYDGLTQQETAKTLGVSQPAIHATYKEAREALRDMLAVYA